MSDLSEFISNLENVSVEGLVVGGLRILLVLVVAVALYLGVRLITHRVVRAARSKSDDLQEREREKRAETIASIARAASTVVIGLVALLMIINLLGYSIAPLIAGAGVVGLAIGFGAQSLVRDFITGFFILLENQYGVGDWVQINGVDGVVKSLGLRITVLQDLEGVTHIMPNGTIELVSNMTKEYNQSLLDVRVAYKEDLDRVRDVLEEVGSGLKKDPRFGSRILDEPQVLGVEDLGETGVTVRMICKTAADQKWAITRELRRRVKSRFDEEGIEIPNIPYAPVLDGAGGESQ